MSKYVPLTSKMMPDACAVFQDVANKINVSALMLKISSATGEMPFTDDELIYILSHADHLVRHSIPLLPRPLETPSGTYTILSVCIQGLYDLFAVIFLILDSLTNVLL